MLENNVIINGKVTVRHSLQILDKVAKKVLFVEKDNKLVGAVSDGDIRRWILNNGNINESIDKVMNRDPVKMNVCDYAMARELMHRYEILAVPVVNAKGEIIEIYFWSDEEDEKCSEKIDLKVVIMAGGKGERLLPYTSVVPKPLIPIGEHSIIERVINSFKKYGCMEYILSLNYKKNMIKAYFEDVEKEYSISYIEEEKPMGTGGSLSLLRGQLDDTFIVSNCDILLNINYNEVYNFHKKNGNLVTIVTSLKHYIIPYGIININDIGEVKSLTERPGSDYLVNTGVYFLEPEVLDKLNDNEFVHITELIEKCIADNFKVGTYPISEEAWMDMGQFEDMEKMKLKLNELQG